MSATFALIAHAASRSDQPTNGPGDARAVPRVRDQAQDLAESVDGPLVVMIAPPAPMPKLDGMFDAGIVEPLVRSISSVLSDSEELPALRNSRATVDLPTPESPPVQATRQTTSA